MDGRQLDRSTYFLRCCLIWKQHDEVAYETWQRRIDVFSFFDQDLCAQFTAFFASGFWFILSWLICGKWMWFGAARRELSWKVDIWSTIPSVTSIPTLLTAISSIPCILTSITSIPSFLVTVTSTPSLLKISTVVRVSWLATVRTSINAKRSVRVIRWWITKRSTTTASQLLQITLWYIWTLSRSQTPNAPL